jgi:hypothetical protein
MKVVDVLAAWLASPNDLAAGMNAGAAVAAPNRPRGPLAGDC